MFEKLMYIFSDYVHILRNDGYFLTNDVYIPRNTGCIQRNDLYILLQILVCLVFMVYSKVSYVLILLNMCMYIYT